MKRHNKIALAAGALALAGLVVWALQPRPVAIETAEVTRGTFEQTVSDDGRTRVRDRYVVAAPLAGRVERIALKAGDAVKAGQVVALLRPTAPAFLDVRTERELRERIGTAEAQLLRARTEVARVAAQRDQSTADLDRATRLYREGFVSATAREQAQLSLKVAEKTVEAAKFGEEAARHELAQARAALTRYRSGTPSAQWEVTAPVTGAVLKVVQESEGPVALGAPLLELADLGSMEAIVEVLSQEAVSIQPGMAARVELGTGVPPLSARVRLIEPAAFTKISALGVEEQRVNVVLDFAEPLDRINTLGDGFRVDADIVTRRVGDAITVPVGALFRDGDGWAVFVVDGNRAVKRPVQVPRRNGVSALVEAGLKAGEKVVVYPSDSLKDGARVAGP
jgi:HlyD family secretion protein